MKTIKFRLKSVDNVENIGKPLKYTAYSGDNSVDTVDKV